MPNEEPHQDVAAAKSAEPLLDAKIGLCARCDWVRVQSTKRGSVFYRCARADEDDAYLRYPPLPVRHCRGFESETI